MRVLQVQYITFKLTYFVVIHLWGWYIKEKITSPMYMDTQKKTQKRKGTK